MASIKSLGGDKYRVFICDGFRSDGRVNRTSKVITAKSLTAAKKQAQEMEVDFKRGKQVQFSTAPTFLMLVNKWRELKMPDLEMKTQDRYEGILNAFLLPSFGKMKVRDIKAIDIESYLKSLSKDGIRVDGKSGGYSEKTIHHHYMFIQTLLNLAVKWDLLEYNPCIKVDTPKVHKTEAGYYEEDDIKQLLDCLDMACEETVNRFSCAYNRYEPDEAYRRQQIRIFNDLMHKTYIWVAMASACRRGELAGLTVENIDFTNNLIVIKQTGHYSPKIGLYFNHYLKNGSSSKTVDMPAAVMKQLEIYLNTRQQIFNLMGWRDEGFAFISLEDGKVTRAGGAIMPDVISKWFSRFLKKYNLPEITLHEVRHTSISYLINRSVDIKKVSDRAGHQNTRTTEEIYGHIYSKSKRATADEYNDLFNDRMVN